MQQVESIWEQFKLTYTNLACVVTDTEPTMVKAGHSAEQGGQLGLRGCTDHILELVTGIAMKDDINSIGDMAKARELVGFFSNLLQAEGILLSKQAEAKAVKCTYSICSCLLWLWHYFWDPWIVT